MPELNRIYQGDCLEIMRGWPDHFIHAIVIDPVWPNAKVQLHGSDNPHEALRRAAAEFPRLLTNDGILVVHLGCDSDVRILTAIPAVLPFVRVAWLRYARPHYKGRILYGADTAYVFGSPRVPEGRHIMPGEHTLTENRRPHNAHPCPRQLSPVQWLVASYTRQNDIVLDCFSGSGTTLCAAQRLGRKWIGIEIEPKYCAIAQARMEAELAQGRLF